ncbi:unnamed protein product [Owenia fusiformis]|uniref:beta-glucosidase n=1 Tax=Owenia fusiformis TaxID=6347 RepID=A0A8S4QBI5_OWEFU|nr:unnamed protein product [Owenia fusiformis]
MRLSQVGACVLLAVVSIQLVPCKGQATEFLFGTFPDNFWWSTATSSYQIEGAWNVSGKGLNIWDTYCHVGGNVNNNDTGDVACDSYNKYDEDIKLMKELGVSHYRFSISWARIFPDGTKASYNQAGIDHYEKLVDALKANDIIPMITLYHWDLPQALQDMGGWTNESLIGHFNDYADVMFEKLGPKVDLWLTFNEPFVVCWLGYGVGAHAPGIKEAGTSTYECAHTIIKSHAKAWHTYDTKYRATQKGKIGITLDSDWKEAFNASNPDDVAAADRAMQFKLGWFAHPIFVNGDYPEVMKAAVYNKSMAQGLDASRQPSFTEAEKQEIKGTHDFFGLNHYTTQLIEPRDWEFESWEQDQEAKEIRDPSWPDSGSDWLKVVPWGLRKLLSFVKDNYGNQEIIITENGVSIQSNTKEDALNDQARIDYYRGYINEVLKAIRLDNVNVIAYTAWSLLDNFEWSRGYAERFGLHYVDFDDPARPRTAKESAKYIKQLIKDHGFPDTSGGSKKQGSAIVGLCSVLGVILLKLFN